jgi:hypothetical protein
VNRILPVCGLLAVAAFEPISAQSAPHLTLDFAVGVSSGGGGSYMGRDGIAGELTIAAKRHTTRLSAVSVGVRASLAGDKCVPAPGIGSRCLETYPTIAHVGVLGGAEQSVGISTLRVLVGPAIYGGSGPSGIGGQCQVDVAFGVSHVALALGAQGDVVARFGGQTLYLGSMRLGMRLR